MVTVGIDIGATKMEAALVCEGKILHSLREDTQKEAITAQATRLASQLAPGKPVGIGIAGQVQEGVVINAPNIGLKNYPLQKLLEETLHAPVTVINDVQASAFGELRYGAAKKSERLFEVSAATTTEVVSSWFVSRMIAASD